MKYPDTIVNEDLIGRAATFGMSPHDYGSLTELSLEQGRSELKWKNNWGKEDWFDPEQVVWPNER